MARLLIVKDMSFGCKCSVSSNFMARLLNVKDTSFGCKC